jgi:hypothetical protein
MQLAEVQAGFLSSLDRFETYLAGLARGTERTSPDRTGTARDGKEQP